MQTSGCSRPTMNKVLSALTSAGLLERRRRASSFVSRPWVRSAILQIPHLQAEVEKTRRALQLSAARAKEAPGVAARQNPSWGGRTRTGIGAALPS
jgi:DNA-binding GntR family transcriptional regulator